MTINTSLKSAFPSASSEPSKPSESVASGTSVDASIAIVNASIANVGASTDITPEAEASASTTSLAEPKANLEPQPEAAVVIPPEEEYVCPQCNNNPRVKKCKECGCQKCFLKDGDPLVCDQCQMYWHMECAELEQMPEENYWYNKHSIYCAFVSLYIYTFGSLCKFEYCFLHCIIFQQVLP